MTRNFFVECPVCKAITRIRVPAGYINISPIRIHCGKCQTILTGEVILNPSKGSCLFSGDNCTEIISKDHYYDYCIESSAELLSHKIVEKNDSFDFLMPFLSTAMRTLNRIETESLKKYIDYVCHINDLKNDWSKHVILYDLYSNRSFENIKNLYRTDSINWGINLNDQIEYKQYIHYKYLYDFGMIFGEVEFKKIIKNISYEVNHLDKTKLKDYLSVVLETNRLQNAENKMYDIMREYIKISLYIMPALSTTFYKETVCIDYESEGLSTCSFNDIKNFYADSYELLAEFCDIIKCLDNLKYRSGYNDFGTNMTLEKFNHSTSKGNKIKELNDEEFFSNIFRLDNTSNDLRNAIDHGDFEYNGITQIITYKPNRQNSEDIRYIFLLDVAICCLNMMKSSIVLSNIIFELFRIESAMSGINVNLHPIFYSSLNSNNHCICGSGKKYKHCCKEWVKENKKSINKFVLPYKSNVEFSTFNKR